MVLAKPVSATGHEPMARIAAATMVGTAVEYYDFYLYTSAAALIFRPLFFPTLSAAAAYIAAVATISAAFVARPIGAVFFGHCGDRFGRKVTLVASMLVILLLLTGLLSDAAMRSWGWRIPFLASVVLIGIGLYVRVSLAETPAFRQLAARRATVRVPVWELLRHQGRAVLLATGATVLGFAMVFLVTSYGLACGAARLHLPAKIMIYLAMLSAHPGPPWPVTILTLAHPHRHLPVLPPRDRSTHRVRRAQRGYSS